MNESRGAFLRVGLLIVAGAGLLVGLIWFLGGSKIRGGTLYESYFRESVQGLEIGVAVKYRGVSIGRVTDIGLVTAEYMADSAESIDKETYRLVFVRYLVDPKRLGRVPDTDAAVKLGLRSRLASAGLTGVTYIELDFVDPVRSPVVALPWTPKVAYIPSVRTTLSEVEDATKLLIDQVNKIDLVKFANSANTLLDTSTALMRDLQAQTKAADVPGLLADIRQTSTALRALTENPDLRKSLANSAVATEQLTRLIAQIPPMIAQFPPLIAAAQGVTKRADAGVADTQQALVPLLRDMAAAVANLRDLTDGLRRNPAQILVGQPPTRQPERSP